VKKRNPYSWLRWIARITGTLVVLFFLFWMGGEILEGKGKPQTSFDFQAWTFFGTWGIATAGLVLALWKEGLGGIISLISYFVVNYLSQTNAATGIIIIGSLVFLAGFILFFWFEYLGTILSLAGYILTFIPYLIIPTGTGAERNLHILFLISSLPSVLYLVYWKLKREKLRKVDVVKPEESI
jgi:hypothetical protein